MKVGLEIESPFIFYFPELHNKHFGTGKKFLDFSPDEHYAFVQDLESVEHIVQNKLKVASLKYNLTRGNDRYWEFIFPPSETATDTLQRIDGLILDNLLSEEIPMSVHFTISGIDRQMAYSVIHFMELKYCTKERILEGFNPIQRRRTWNRKGTAGIKFKGEHELQYDKSAFELRTLKLQMKDRYTFMNDLYTLLNDKNIVCKAKESVMNMGLPWKAWGEYEFKMFANHLKIEGGM